MVSGLSTLIKNAVPDTFIPLYLWFPEMRVGERQDQISSDLRFNVKGCKIPSYVFVRFVEGPMDSLLDCGWSCDGAVRIVNALWSVCFVLGTVIRASEAASHWWQVIAWPTGTEGKGFRSSLSIPVTLEKCPRLSVLQFSICSWTKGSFSSLAISNVLR